MSSRAGGQSHVCRNKSSSSLEIHSSVRQAGAVIFLVRDKEVIDSTSVQLYYTYNSLNVTNIFLLLTTPQLNITEDLLGSAFQTFKRGCDFIPAIPSVCEAEIMSNSVSRGNFQTFLLSRSTLT